mgnify:CR=1 FL=1
MANFHENVLAIAANEENMIKVLFRMATNLVANGVQGGFYLDEIAELDTAKDVYYEVAPALVPNFIDAFAGAPLPAGVSASATPGWKSPTSSEDGYKQQIKMLTRITAQFSANAPEGVSVEVTATGPTGQALGDTASLSFERYKKNWLFTIRYVTAWSPNAEDIDVFFMGLPQGEYGVAFYDADECDGYESISVFSGLHHGCAVMHAAEGDCESGTIEREALKTRRDNYSGIVKTDIVDLVELAKYGAATAWNEWGEDEEDFDYEDYEDEDESYGGGEGRESEGEDEGGEGEGSADGDYESIDLLNRPSINWTSPETKDFRKIDRIMFNLIGSFPWVCDLDSGYTPEGNEAAEHLFPGDAVVVSSEWAIGDTPGEVRFKVCDSNGAVIGVLWGWMNLVSDSRERRSSAAALACILPHLRATVWDLMPVSLRNKGVYGPKLSIRFDLDPIAAEELIAQTHALLEKDLNDRALSSKGGE